MARPLGCLTSHSVVSVLWAGTFPTLHSFAFPVSSITTKWKTCIEIMHTQEGEGDTRDLCADCGLNVVFRELSGEQWV